MDIILVHLHWLLASDKNFTEQMKHDFGVQQSSINYRPFLDTQSQWYALIQEVVWKLTDILNQQYDEKRSFIFHWNSAWWVLAAELAIAMYPRTAGLILNCSAWLYENLSEGTNSVMSYLTQAKKSPETMKQLIESFVQLPQDKIPERLLDEITALVYWDNSRQQLARFMRWGQVFKKDTNRLHDAFRSQLTTIAVQWIPSLVIGWVYDTVTTPDTIEQMAKMLHQDAVLLQTGHAPHIQEPEQFNKLTQEFLTKC